MALTKAQIISEITSFYDYVGTPFLVESSDSHLPSTVNNYSVVVCETGNSEKSVKPVIQQKYINFCVYDEGGAGESAYYVGDEIKNDVDADITGDSSLYAINKMFTSEELRKRVQAAVAKSAQDIFNEANPNSLLTSGADASQKNVAVTLGSIFWPGKTVVISDSSNSEDAVIASINTNTLTMTNNLTNSYTVANGAKVTYKDNMERQQWASNAMLSPDVYTLAMTSFVSLNPTIQAAGGAATDNDIQYVVNSNITKLAQISYD